jgi:hypothetical protein
MCYLHIILCISRHIGCWIHAHHLMLDQDIKTFYVIKYIAVNIQIYIQMWLMLETTFSYQCYSTWLANMQEAIDHWTIYLFFLAVAIFFFFFLYL